MINNRYIQGEYKMATTTEEVKDIEPQEDIPSSDQKLRKRSSMIKLDLWENPDMLGIDRLLPLILHWLLFPQRLLGYKNQSMKLMKKEKSKK